ncbi:MAG: hypothetical protein MUE84_05350, partial [Hyphomonas sp.]|nr:hypothetical protein [Hyphomonas sp.]
MPDDSDPSRPELPYAALLWKNPVLRQVFVYTMPEAAKRQAIGDVVRWAAGDGPGPAPLFAVAARFPLERVV